MWKNEMTLMLRAYINDFDCDPTYSDSRLQEILIISSIQVAAQVDLRNSYDISLESLSISPDPTVSPTKDPNFLLLSAYLAAAIITASEFKAFANCGYRLVDQGSEIDKRTMAADKKAVADFYQKAFVDLRLRYTWGNLAGMAIIGPTSVCGAYYGGGYYSNYGYRNMPFFG